ncbi:Fe-S cluster assembly protein SufD [Tepidicaulis sp. LMO-SS28]|uniref:Fe-S cluster assembly protein SufD n=1 Tax=Tepidicaulis sp. LMO-SS28 TaxID=3447455 RepID=UPI003EE15DF0
MSSSVEQNYLDAFAGLTPKDEPAWLVARRKAAREIFEKTGFPHRRVEAWKYTDLRRMLAKDGYVPAIPYEGPLAYDVEAVGPAAAAFGSIGRHRLICVNGFYRPDFSEVELPEGVSVKPLSEAVKEDGFEALLGSDEHLYPLNALNTALMQDGLVIRVEKDVTLDRPLHLIHVTTPAGASAAHMRHVLRLGEGAKAVLLETHVGQGGEGYLANHVMETALGEGAELTHIKLQDEAKDALHIAAHRLALGAKSKYYGFTLTLGARLSRHETEIRFDGEGAHAEAHAAIALSGNQLGDVTTYVDHAVPGCTSNAHIKSVLDDEATGVFQGKVLVAEDAQKTDGRQLSNALLLSRDASMNAKPELEIYADDVQCAHGSTIGELDDDALFYLRSRGIDEKTARTLLIRAFLEEVLETIPLEEAKADVVRLTTSWFAGTDVTEVEE